MEQKLWHILENVNRWLEYAERKNAILLSFIGAQLTIGKIFIESPSRWILAASVLLGICFVLTLLSFFPKTIIPEFVRYFAKSAPRETDNLLFYGDISNYSVNLYTKKLEKYFGEDIRTNRYLEDICTQIVVNSQIANNKYRMFKASTWFMIFGQFCFLLSFWS